MNDPRTSLPLVGAQQGAHSCGCGGSCGCNHDQGESAQHSHTPSHFADNHSNIQTFTVTGMTCGHCVNAVTEEVKNISGVTDVSVDLVAGGTSTVTVVADQPVADADVAAALDEAGDYALSTS